MGPVHLMDPRPPAKAWQGLTLGGGQLRMSGCQDVRPRVPIKCGIRAFDWLTPRQQDPSGRRTILRERTLQIIGELGRFGNGGGGPEHLLPELSLFLSCSADLVGW